MEKQDRPDSKEVEIDISFVAASPPIYKMAEEILQTTLSCDDELRKRIRLVAKALIDETDELNRSQHEIKSLAAKGQLQTKSPPEMVETAKTLLAVDLSNDDHQKKVRLVAKCYVGVASQNRKLYEEFIQKYGHLFRPNKEP